MLIFQTSRHLPILILSIIYLIFGFLTFQNYGVTTDEPLEYQSAEKLLKFIMQGAKYRTSIELDSIPEDIRRHEPETSMYFRGHLLIHSYLFSSKDYFELHLLNIILALPLFIISYYVFLYIFKKWYLAILAPLVLLIDPRITGHIPANPKDLPFASFVLIYILLSSLKFIGIKRYVLNIVLGIILGFLVGIRPLGILIPASIFLLSITEIFKVKDKLKIIKTITLTFLVQVIIAFTLLYFLWPYFGTNPLVNFFNFLFYSANFPDWSGTVLFNGQYLNSSQIPPWYLFTWISITTPLFQIVMLCIFLFKIKKYWSNSLVKNILVVISLNIIIYILFSPLIYNSIRHYLFLTSLITLICAFVLISLIEDIVLKKEKLNTISLSLIAVISASLIFLFKDNVELYPYQSVYFNEISGGLKSSGVNYDTDYWLQSRLEATNWVAKNTNTYAEKIYVCNLSEIVKYYQPRLEITKDKDDATISICDSKREIEREIQGEIIYSVSRDGISLTNVRRLKKL